MPQVSSESLATTAQAASMAFDVDDPELFEARSAETDELQQDDE
jgi:hypothetical protein